MKEQEGYLSLEEKIAAFDRLVHQAASLHKLTWCIKLRQTRDTSGLRGEECLRCRYFLFRDGTCDPL